MRRALFIVITDHPGGAERVAYGLAAELASRPGWQVEVTIVCARTPGSFSAQVLPPEVKMRFGPFRNPVLSFPLLPVRLLFGRYDLVFTTHIYTNALLSMLRRWGLIRIRTFAARESTAIFDRSLGWKRRLFARLYRAYGSEDLLIAQTGYMARHVASRVPAASANRIRILPNPVDPVAIERASLPPLDLELQQRLAGRRNILFCGRLVAIKRPGVALDAFRIAAGQDPQAQLVFLGGGLLEAGLRRQADDAGIAERVLFLGFRPNPYPIMSSCDFGLVTSAREGFPNVILEMMASGMAKIVTTPCAGDLDQLPGVAITDGFGADAIAAALGAVLRTEEDCRSTYRKYAASRSVPAYVDALLRDVAA